MRIERHESHAVFHGRETVYNWQSIVSRQFPCSKAIMFRIKICGITNTEDAQAVASSGADAIGLNFYPQSPRFVQREQAAQIADTVPASITKVGVFVNASSAEIEATCRDVSLDWIQLHGDEPPEFLTELGDKKIIRALRLDERGGDQSLDAITRYLDACLSNGRLPDALLIDAHVSGQYGGTGSRVDWQSLGDQKDSAWRHGLPWALAGGLTPSNVAEAIGAARPDAVDTASGVESAPGKKDPSMCRSFVSEARKEFG